MKYPCSKAKMSEIFHQFITGGVKPIDNRKWKISEHAQKPPRWTVYVSCASAPDIPPVFDRRFLTSG